LLYSLYPARRNNSLSELKTLPKGGPSARQWNYGLALLTGASWYGQFFFYNLGHVHLGAQYSFSSWAIHMTVLVPFSNLAAGLTVLCGAILMITCANRLGECALTSDKMDHLWPRHAQS